MKNIGHPATFLALGLLVMVNAGCVHSNVDTKQMTQSLYERIQPAPKNGGYHDDDYWVWGGRPVLVGSTYHLFVSRWPKSTGRFGVGWITHSEVVRCTSPNPGGPYVYQETVLPSHHSEQEWAPHNPEIHQAADGTFVLFYNSRDHTGKGFLSGMATAPTVEGPWTRKPMWDWGRLNVSNPSGVLHPDGSVTMLFKTPAPDREGLHLVAYRARHYDDWPYTDGYMGYVSVDVTQEDPTPFFIDGHFEVLAHKHSSDRRDQLHWISKDETGAPGTWGRAEPFVAVDAESIRYDDGTKPDVRRLERPKVFQNADGAVTWIFFAVNSGDRSFNIGMPVDPPYTGGVPGDLMEPPLSIQNLALGKAASQSSTNKDLSANLAVNRVTHSTYSQTDSEAQPWWEVDLGVENSIGKIAIWNREGEARSRLSDYTVQVRNAEGQETWRQVQDQVAGRPTTIDVGGARGRYVRIQLNGTNYLNLVEVEVFPQSYPIAYPRE